MSDEPRELPEPLISFMEPTSLNAGRQFRAFVTEVGMIEVVTVFERTTERNRDGDVCLEIDHGATATSFAWRNGDVETLNLMAMVHDSGQGNVPAEVAAGFWAAVEMVRVSLAVSDV